MNTDKHMKSYEDAVAFHGHSCGGLAMGYKAAELAAKLLDLSFSEDEEVVCVTETDSCTVDAIQVLLGCTAGKGNLFVNKWGKNAFSFYNRKTGKSVRLVANPNVVPMNSELVEVRTKVFSGKGTPEDAEHLHELMHKFTDAIMAIPADKLFTVKETKALVPEKARIYDNVVCSVCGEQVAEGLCEKIDGKYVCVPCARKK